ncbi:hypothetical protein GGS26DRAFT_528750 [Hypomontagnella submonticulosa]|nr:hypothetical protein GGS26DRAFT_528750 [Hypomontagnella submonticulosa]
MAPTYRGQSFTVEEAIAAAGDPPPPQARGFEHVWQGEPPVEFFLEVDPYRAYAIFSTNNGATPFRMVENPTLERDLEYWSARQIQDFCDDLRHKYFARCKYVAPLQSLEDLYIYFDAHDIYYLGAQNLWNVIHHLNYENPHYSYEAHDDNVARVRSLVESILTNEDNRKKLTDWDPTVDSDLLDVFKNGELEGLGDLASDYSHVVREMMYSIYLNDRRGRPIFPGYRVGIPPYVAADQPYVAPDEPQVPGE